MKTCLRLLSQSERCNMTMQYDINDVPRVFLSKILH